MERLTSSDDMAACAISIATNIAPKLILLLALVFIAYTAVAKTIYQYQDKQGHPVYTDEFHPGAMRLQLGVTGLYDATTETATSESIASEIGATKAKKPDTQPAILQFKTIQYQIAIISPKPDQAIRQNQGNVNIKLLVKPKLLIGDKIQVVLDGKVIDKTMSKTDITLKNIDRGTHRLRINIINEHGEIMISSHEITFHLLRFHVR